ncbi:MAG: DUF1906 domain-containing protein [Solirubrobacterales bacterium]|nr:DUF1906 domain-containing protein [Solirubrobacterales bacterium]
MKRWFICISLLCLAATSASAAARQKTVTYRGHSVSVPASWPVIDLAKHPTTCVRLDRRAVYLGRPSADQHCPSHAVGQHRAIVLEPTARGATAVTDTAPSATAARDSRRPAHAASAAYLGKGFESCSAPSTSTMSAWSQSQYHAVGIYLGGINAACAQPNLTASWVSTETAAGWHLIPTWVGLQGDGSCGGTCKTITPGAATAQGSMAADNAAARARSLGIPPGNPIFFDMEQYSGGSSKVLKFLSAWTSELHSQGYISGVYSSASSGISDLVANHGNSSFTEPDEIWIADWDGNATTSDPYVPSSYWANHQRIRQYRGGHNETHGGRTLNIDDDYLDAVTADTQGTLSHPPACVVPKLRHKTIKQSRRALARAHCRLGKVRRPKHTAPGHKLRVVSQSPKAGKHKPNGYRVRVTLA